MNNTTKRIFLAVACCGFLAVLYSADRIPLVAGDPDGPQQTGDALASAGPIKATGYETTTRQNFGVEPGNGIDTDNTNIYLDVNELTTVTAVSGDSVAIADASDSGNTKKALISDILTMATAALDGDKGDITVSGGGTAWDIDSGITLDNVTISSSADGTSIVTESVQTPVWTVTSEGSNIKDSEDTSLATITYTLGANPGFDFYQAPVFRGLTGYLYGNNASDITASTTIPNTSITGLGTMSTQNANSVAITGGSVNGTTVGASTPSTGAFTTLSASSTSTLAAVNASGTVAVSGTSPAFQWRRNSTVRNDAFTASATANNAPVLGLNRSRGTITSPSAASSGDALGYIWWGLGDPSSSSKRPVAFNATITAGESTNTPGKLVLNVTSASQSDAFASGTEAQSWTATEIVMNDGGADLDVRMEGDTVTDVFYLDAGNNRVGFGTTTPAAILDVDGEARITTLGIGGAATGALSTQNNVVVFNETGDANGDLRVESDSVTSMFYVDAGADRVAVGTSSPSQEFHVVGDIRIQGRIEFDHDNDDTVDSAIIAGDGSPEGIVAAPIGSTYHRSDGGAGTSLYVKESGSGNTGWVAK